MGSKSKEGEAEDSAKRLQTLLRVIYRGDMSGRRAAWNDLLLYVLPKIREICNLILHKCGTPTLELDDMANDVTAELWVTYGKVQGAIHDPQDELLSDNIYRICQGIARNRLNAHLHRKAREREGLSGREVEELSGYDPSASQCFRGKERGEAVATLMEFQLGAEDQRIVRLRTQHETSYKEVIRVLGLDCTEADLRQRISRLKKRLRGILSDEWLDYLSENH
jgi:RNA polymerase sigma factor (sigma-70 family)